MYEVVDLALELVLVYELALLRLNHAQLTLSSLKLDLLRLNQGFQSFDLALQTVSTNARWALVTRVTLVALVARGALVAPQALDTGLQVCATASVGPEADAVVAGRLASLVAEAPGGSSGQAQPKRPVLLAQLRKRLHSGLAQQYHDPSAAQVCSPAL